MESVDFQEEVPSIGSTVVSQQSRVCNSLLTDIDVAEHLVVTVEWVRSHADEIPGLRRLGMYYRFQCTPFELWAGREPLLLPEEVAGMLKVPKSWVYTNANRIPGVLRLGRYVRFRPSMLLELLNGSEVVQ